MSLKELTKDSHTAAEATPFMKAVFKKSMPASVWADYTYQKSNFYASIETVARYEGLTVDMLEIERALRLYLDAKEMNNGVFPRLRPITIEYSRYLLDLVGQPERIMAHLYTWHMGDLFGGQMIKKVLADFPHRNLEFKDVDELKVKMRTKLDVSMADEANIAFQWAIKIMESYNDELGVEHAD
jgi:heme oxygenase